MIETGTIWGWLFVALQFAIVFVIVFGAQFIVAISLPGSGPGWLVWPILAFMLSVSGFAAYEIVLDPLLDDDGVECGEPSTEASNNCPPLGAGGVLN